MKIRTKLMSGFLLVAMIIAIAGTLGIYQIGQLHEKSKEVAVKGMPLADATMELRLAATTAHLWFEEIITGTEPKEEITKAWKLLDESLWYCDAILVGKDNSAEGTFIATDDVDIRIKTLTIKEKLEEFKKIAQMRFTNAFEKKDVEDQILDQKFDATFGEFSHYANEVEKIVQAKIEIDIRDMAGAATWGKLILIVATLLSIVAASLAIYYISREILHQVGGEPSEIAYITHQVAAGNLDLQFESQTQKLTGIYAAVQVMVKNLRAANEERERQNWLKTGVAQLNEKMSGEQEIIQLAENIINFLTPYLDAQVGAFYLFQEGEHYHLKMIASHAYTWRKHLANEFKLGEGLVGQAALERKAIVITSAPADYLPIQSGLGEATPKSILVLPFLYEGTLKGIIELAALAVFNKIQLELLKQVANNIGIAVNTCQSRSKMQVLLHQSQIQAEELQQQSEELQTQQEELQQTNEELQSQTEELQTQQEELKQINEELEERTRELERQQSETQQKNVELEKTQQAIKTKAQELELASKYKSEFLANMSHELRTPLNSLLILAQLLADNKDNTLTAKQLEYARTIRSAGSDLLTLINDILDLSKVEAGKVELQVENLSLQELVEMTEQKFQAVADEKGVVFKTIIAEHLPAVIRTDPQRLKQVINNLLSNAFKFTHEGEVTLAIQRPVTSKIPLGFDANKTIAMNISDTGIGIPKDKQQIIFEAFQQADGTTSRRYGGTGLGLSISRQLTRLLQGEIQLVSEEGKGSTFTLYLPEAAEVSKENLTHSTNWNSNFDLDQKTLKEPPVTIHALPSTTEPPFSDDREQIIKGDKVLLIVDDDRKFDKILLELGHEKHFKILIAEDGETGLQLVERYVPSAIILDVGLPRLNGWTVMERLKDNPNTRHIPVYFISAADQSMDAKRMGAIGYSLKPINMEELGEVFRKIDQFINKNLKKLLVITANERQWQEILGLIDSDTVEKTLATTVEIAKPQVEMFRFDCIIVDVEKTLEIQLLAQLVIGHHWVAVPIIIYANRELTPQEEQALQQWQHHFTLKIVHSPERLLDETTLFLHQVESDLATDKQKMLRLVHNKEAILHGKKVLIVDDDVRNTFALLTFLEERGMEVLVASNGNEALTMLEEHPEIDIVLMDIMMPEMDGYEATQQIRKQARFRKLPIIALTAKAMKGDKSKCIDAGASDYLAKPVDTDRLISLLRVWLYR